MFLPDLAKSYLLAYHQKLSVPCLMNGNVTREQDGIVVGHFGTSSAYQDASSKSIIELLPNRFNKDYPLREVLRRANTFSDKFLSEKGQYPAHNFITPGWIYSIENMWWSRMVNFILTIFRNTFRNFGLYSAIRNVQFGLLQNTHHLNSVLEMVNHIPVLSSLQSWNLALPFTSCSRSCYCLWENFHMRSTCQL